MIIISYTQSKAAGLEATVDRKNGGEAVATRSIKLFNMRFIYLKLIGFCLIQGSPLCR